MQKAEKKPVYRRDYREPDHWITSVELWFDLGEDETRVRARLDGERNARSNAAGRPLVLSGEELELTRVALDGHELSVGELEVGNGILTIPGVGERFRLETEVVIRPQENQALVGLYKSSGNFCTQCEAEGFRRITWFLDRPDVMARYTTTITADRERYPVLLSNGNRIAARELPDGRHEVTWRDPFKKPSYLFALVAGDLRCHRGTFVTASGREVALEIWVEPQNIDRCEHALRSLQNAMKWDEEVFGREYDLDVYMIVAVNDFNMGAMENKGLNVFNSKYVLADPQTATDTDYEGIEGVVAHEYFHNWTGNRVTCRDWFQLTLKEGLTVFRDQQFSADMTSAPVKRISEVKVLRTMQFAEDAGPMAHPVRPESYIEMNNFYTTTVYNKGAEVVRMLHTLLGADGFRRGMDLYFERHDGQAVTCDDFRNALADANGADFSQFERWYRTAGTPRIDARGVWDERARTYALTLAQSVREVPGLEAPRPLHVPVALGLIGADGRDLPLSLAGEPGGGATTRVLELRDAEQTWVFEGVHSRPTPSLLRGFSAPVELRMERGRDELAFLMAHDSDPFNRWDAGQTLAIELLLELVGALQAGVEPELDRGFVAAFERVLVDPELDGSLKALALSLPSERLLGQQMAVVAVDEIHAARERVSKGLARALHAVFQRTYEANRPRGAYSNDKQAIDRRRLKNLCLAYLTRLDDPRGAALAHRQFTEADNMTDGLAALACLVEMDVPEREPALEAFYERWKADPLVVDKWFAVQALSQRPDAFERVLALSRHPAFNAKNPNRVYSLLVAFAAQNQLGFHRADGAAYEFIADRVLDIDAYNPQVAARLVSQFNQWRRFDAGRQQAMRAQLERIAARAQLSDDVAEIVGRALRTP